MNNTESIDASVICAAMAVEGNVAVSQTNRSSMPKNKTKPSQNISLKDTTPLKMHFYEFCSDDEREQKRDNLIKIHVGGEIILVTRDVLTRMSNSKLASMINGNCEDIPALDADGNIFLDCNPNLFRHLLEQLRLVDKNDCRPVFYPPHSRLLFQSFRQMMSDLNFHLAPLGNDDIITLNVGGEIFVTRRETLARVPNSKLAIIVSSYNFMHTDANGYAFLDFDPKLFRHLLIQLRSPSCQRTCIFRPLPFDDQEAFNAMLIVLGLIETPVVSTTIAPTTITTTMRTTTTTTNAPTTCLLSYDAKITASSFCNAQRTSCAPPVAVAHQLKDILDPVASLDNNWNSRGYAPQYIQLEFPVAQTVSHVFLQVHQLPNGYTHHSLLTGAEEHALRKVKILSGNTNKYGWINITFSPPLENIRFLRVNTISSPSWVAWFKFLVYKK